MVSVSKDGVWTYRLNLFDNAREAPSPLWMRALFLYSTIFYIKEGFYKPMKKDIHRGKRLIYTNCKKMIQT